MGTEPGTVQGTYVDTERPFSDRIMTDRPLNMNEDTKDVLSFRCQPVFGDEEEKEDKELKTDR